MGQFAGEVTSTWWIVAAPSRVQYFLGEPLPFTIASHVLLRLCDLLYQSRRCLPPCSLGKTNGLDFRASGFVLSALRNIVKRMFLLYAAKRSDAAHRGKRENTCVARGSKSSLPIPPQAFLSSSAIGLLPSLFSARFCPVPSSRPFSASSSDDEDTEELEEDEAPDVFLLFSRWSLKKVHRAGHQGVSRGE